MIGGLEASSIPRFLSPAIAGLKRGAVEPKNDSARLLRGWIERHTFTWLVSVDILTEYREVLARLRVRRAVISRVLNLLSEEAELVYPRVPTGISPDPDDEPFCACADSGNATFIVTLNPKDFPEGRLKSRIVLPGEAHDGIGLRRTAQGARARKPK